MLTQILTRCEPNISYIDRAYYHYVLEGPSLTRQVSRRSFEAMKRFHNKALGLLPRTGAFGDIESRFSKNEFIVYFMNKLYADSAELKQRYKECRTILWCASGLRWRLGYLCISLGLLTCAHKLIRY